MKEVHNEFELKQVLTNGSLILQTFCDRLKIYPDFPNVPMCPRIHALWSKKKKYLDFSSSLWQTFSTGCPLSRVTLRIGFSPLGD